MTFRPNSGRRSPRQPQGDAPANGNGHSKQSADQGDLWSDESPAVPASPTKPSTTAPASEPPVDSTAAPKPANGGSAGAAKPRASTRAPATAGAVEAGAVETEAAASNAPAVEDADTGPDEDIDADAGAKPLPRSLPVDGEGSAADLATDEDALGAQSMLATQPDLLQQVAAEAGEPALDEPFVEYDEEAYEDYEPYYEADDLSLLRNPYVLAGVAVALAIVLAVIVVFLFGQGGDNGGNNGIVTTGTQTPGAGGQVAGLGVKSIATATVREGPGLDYLELGLLRNKQDVQVVGRNEDASWYQIVFPRDSQLRGWVPDSALDLSDSAAQALAVVQVTPITRPTVAIPTPTPRPPDPTPSATATPEGGGDKVDIGVVIAADCSPNTDIVLLLTNAGNAHIKSEVEVLVSNNGTVVYDEDMDADLAPGQTATVNTRVKAKAPSMTATVLLKGAQDVSAANNITSCSVSGGGGGGNGGNSGNGNGNGNNNGGTSVPPPVGTQTDDDN